MGIPILGLFISGYTVDVFRQVLNVHKDVIPRPNTVAHLLVLIQLSTG